MDRCPACRAQLRFYGISPNADPVIRWMICDMCGVFSMQTMTGGFIGTDIKGPSEKALGIEKGKTKPWSQVKRNSPRFSPSARRVAGQEEE